MIQHERAVEILISTQARSGGAEKMLRFFRPWGNKDAAPAPARPGRAAYIKPPADETKDEETGDAGTQTDDSDTKSNKKEACCTTC